MPWGGLSEALQGTGRSVTHRGEKEKLAWFLQSRRRRVRAGGQEGWRGLHPPGRDRLPGRVQGWSQGNKGMGLTLSGRPFTLRSHLKTGVAATPGWGETRVTAKSDSKTRPHMSARPPPGRPHFSPTASPITNAKMPSNTTTTTMIISNFFRA